MSAPYHVQGVPMNPGPRSSTAEHQASLPGMLVSQKPDSLKRGSSTLPAGSIFVRRAGRVLWLAFRAWNALLLGVLGASLAIVGAVLLGASWGAWPFSWAWLGDFAKNYKAAAGAGDGEAGLAAESGLRAATNRGTPESPEKAPQAAPDPSPAARDKSLERRYTLAGRSNARWN